MKLKILMYCKDRPRIPFIDYYVKRQLRKIEQQDSNAQSESELKKIIEKAFPDEATLIKYSWNNTGLENEIDLIFPNNIDLYIENLQFNGLIVFEHNRHFSHDEEIYTHLISKYSSISSKLDIELSKVDSKYIVEPVIQKGFIQFTELGRQFIKACMKELEY